MACGNCTKNGLTSCGCSDNCPYKTSDITVFDGTFTSIVLESGAGLNEALAALEQYVVDTVDALNLVYTVSPSNCLGIAAGEYGYTQLIDAIISSICDIQANIDEIENNITSIEGDITNIQGDITDIQSEITDVNAAISETMPIGSMIMYPIPAAPSSKWMLCEGQFLNKNTYADLFDVIGYNFGGFGTTFKLPDVRGKFLAGFDSASPDYSVAGQGAGSDSITLAKSNIPPHTHGPGTLSGTTDTEPNHEHQILRGQGAVGSGTADRFDATDVDSGTENTQPAGAHSHAVTVSAGTTENGTADGLASNAFDNRPEFIVFPWIIKVMN